jgi:hypothetical protein
MRYYVTFGGFDDHGKAAPAAVDQGSPEPFRLSDALAHACRLLSEGKPNVSIQDDSGNSIDGDELAACCRDERKLTAELRAF